MVLVTIALLRPSTFSAKTNATLAFTASVDGRLVNIDGVSDLPDGAIITWGLAHELKIRDIGAPHHDPNTPDLRGGGVVLAGGHFHASTNVAGWPPGKVEVTVEFIPWGGQRSDIVARFGEAGEHLGGPAVQTDSGDERRLMVWSTLALG
jgi:hypothetical protein